MDVCNLNAPLGNNCYCDCHKTWNGLIPSRCICNCNTKVFTIPSSNSFTSPTNFNNDHFGKIKSESDKDLFEILKKLEKLLTNLEKDIKELLPSRNGQVNNKRPYKCPICNGSIKIYIDPKEYMSGIESMFGKKDINGMYYKDCNSCDKKGIVWG